MFVISTTTSGEKDFASKLEDLKSSRIMENFYFHFLKVVTVLGILILAASASGMPLDVEGCQDDNHCEKGYFCNIRTETCVRCGELDCSKYLRVSGSVKCIKTKNDCGPCIEGYTLIHDHCRPNPETRIQDKTEQTSTVVPDQNLQTASGLVVNLLISGVIGLLIVTMIGFIVYCCMKKKSSHGLIKAGTLTSSENPLTTYSIEYQSPPPYFLSSSAPCQAEMVSQELNRAIPFQASLFDIPVQAINDESPQEVPNYVVPEQGSINGTGENEDLPNYMDLNFNIVEVPQAHVDTFQEVPEFELSSSGMDIDYPEEASNTNPPPPIFNAHGETVTTEGFLMDLQFEFRIETIFNLIQLIQQEAQNLIPIPAVGELDESVMTLEDEP